MRLRSLCRFLLLFCGVLLFPTMEPTDAYSATEEPATFDLDQIIELALDRNPVIAGAAGAIQQNDGRRIEAKAYVNPTITGQSGSASLRDPSTGTSLNEYLFTFSQPVEWSGKRAARQRAAESGFDGATIGMEEARLDLIAEVKGAFYDLLLAQRTVELTRRNKSIAEEVARVVKARVKSGEGAQFEAIKAEVEMMKANQELTRAKNSVLVRLVGLDTLTAGALGSQFTIRGDFRSFQGDINIKTLTVRGLAQHPTLRRLEKRVEQADYTVSTERQSRVPDVTVFGGYAREIGREAVVAGLSVPTPLWYQRQGQIAAALGSKRRDEAELFRARNELVRAINQHVQEAETAEEQIEVFEQGLLKQAREALRIAQLSFQQGASSLLEVLDAQRVERQILADYYRAQFELSVALTRLERSVSGSL